MTAPELDTEALLEHIRRLSDQTLVRMQAAIDDATDKQRAGVQWLRENQEYYSGILQENAVYMLKLYDLQTTTDNWKVHWVESVDASTQMELIKVFVFTIIRGMIVKVDHGFITVDGSDNFSDPDTQARLHGRPTQSQVDAEKFAQLQAATAAQTDKAEAILAALRPSLRRRLRKEGARHLAQLGVRTRARHWSIVSDEQGEYFKLVVDAATITINGVTVKYDGRKLTVNGQPLPVDAAVLDQLRG